MMRHELTKSAAILSLLLSAVMLVACGGKDAVAPADEEQQAFDDFRDAIKEVIQAPDRQAEALGLVDEFQGEYEELWVAVKVRRTELRRLNADYDATREQFRAFVDKYDADIAAAHARALETRMAFVRSTTAEEWDALKKADTKAMKELVGIIHEI